MKSKLLLRTLMLLLLLGAFYGGWLFGNHPAGNGSEARYEQHEHTDEAIQYTCGMHPWVIVDEPGICPICQMDLTPVSKVMGGEAAATGETKIKYWVAPMDPTFIRDEPGKSPMGMDLVPVYEDEAATGSVISIDPVTAQNMGIRLTPVERRDLTKTIRTVGLVGYEEPKQYSINAKMDGWIEKLHINETGAPVRRNQALLEIYSPELVSAQEEFLLALDNRNTLANSPYPEIAAGAERLLQASKRRLKLWDISDRQVTRLEKTREVLKTLTLYAPYNGIVTLKNATEGSYVKSGMELFQVADLSRVWVYADIYESELDLVKVGQKADIILPFVDGKTVKGTVSTIYPYVEPQTRTVKARIDLENDDLQLKPDMYVNVRLQTDPVREALSIPAEAVLNSGEGRSVFVSSGEGKFEPRQVQTGLYSDDGHVEIKQGLMDDETVVVSAQFMLDSESQLQEAIMKMMEISTPQQSSAEENLDDLF